tara:strand:+ start:242 stop:1579 length:1338 start_codon:yes stop_codon:yes gene_type:complete
MANTLLTGEINTPTNSKKATISGWFKLGKNLLKPQVVLFSAMNSTLVYNYFTIMVENTGYFDIKQRIGSTSPGYDIDMTSERKFLDSSGWYHFCVFIDTTQEVATNRVKVFINGGLLDAYSTRVNPSQDTNLYVADTAYSIQVGGMDNGNSDYKFDGCMTHLHFIDGEAYNASSFGQVDSLTGSWKLTPAPSVTYGNNGFFLFKDNSSVTDQSGNSNDLTLSSGTLTSTQDSPSNVFSSLNAMDWMETRAIFTNGNNTILTDDAYTTYSTSGYGMYSGKYYMEAKAKSHLAPSGNLGSFNIGLVERVPNANDHVLGKNEHAYAYRSDDGDKFVNNNNTTFGSTYTTGDIIGVAADIDNNTITFYKNGVSQGSISIEPVANTINREYFFALGDYGTTEVTWEANFGNGYFGTTQVSTPGTNASGNGIFEFDCPTGFTALSTKGLNL